MHSALSCCGKTPETVNVSGRKVFFLLSEVFTHGHLAWLLGPMAAENCVIAMSVGRRLSPYDSLRVVVVRAGLRFH